MKKKVVFGVVSGIILISAVGLIYWQFSKNKTKPVLSTLPTVKTEKGDVEKVVFAKGDVAETQHDEVYTDVKTKVTRIMVKKGDVVNAGDLLFTMDNGEGLLTLEQQKLEVQSKTRQLQKAVAEARTDLIKSPITGKLTKWNVKEGEKVEKGSVVAEITETNRLQVTAEFGPNGIKRIKVGQKARIFLLSNYSYIDGVISEIQKGKADADGGIIYSITAAFTNPGAVSTGTEASIEVNTGNNPAICSVKNGEVAEPDPIKIKAGLQGTVLKLAIKENKFVNRNSVLAKIDISEGRQNVKDRQLDLQEAQLGRKIKENELSKFSVYATRSGVVSELNIELGKIPPTDKPAVIISGAKGMQLIAEIEEADVPYLHIGQEATVYLNSFGDKKFQGTIAEIADKGKDDGSTVAFNTKINIKEPKGIKIGMTGDTDIVVDKRINVLRLPCASVVIENGKGTVMVQGAKGPVAKDVKVGLEGDEYVEIISGLKLGQEVLLNPTSQN